MYYATSNPFKFRYAAKQLQPFGIELEQIQLDLDEIQSNSVEKIANYKALAAYLELKAPVLVSDATWNIPALNGFPGVFMAYVDSWLSTADFLRLMQDVEDRRVIYTEVVAYIDQHQSKLFSDSAEGIILQDGIVTDYKAFDPIVSFRSDQKSLSQARLEQLPTFDHDLALWDAFARWFISLP